MSNIIQLCEWLKTDLDEIEIGVPDICKNLMKTTYEVLIEIKSIDCAWTVQKRYTEFQGFYDSLTYRYQNISFPPFPSKYQIFNKKENRKKYFDALLKFVLQLAKNHKEIKKEILKLLYDFVLASHIGDSTVQEVKKDKDPKRKLTDSMNAISEKSEHTIFTAPHHSLSTNTLNTLYETPNKGDIKTEHKISEEKVIYN